MDTTAVELKLLGTAIVVGVVQLLWAAIASWSQRDLKWAAGPRDEPRPPLSGAPGRLERAFRNFMETFPLFAAAVLASVLLAKTGPLTMWGSAIYVIGRALYVPLYASGVPVVRSVMWTVSMVGLGMVVLAIFR